MLVLSRDVDESICIGNVIEVKVVRIAGDQVRLGVIAPRSLPVHREEVARQIGPVLDAEACRVGLELLDCAVELTRFQCGNRASLTAEDRRALSQESGDLSTLAVRLLAGAIGDLALIRPILVNHDHRRWHAINAKLLALWDRVGTALDAARNLKIRDEVPV